ncbi:hypothetical protein FYK17_12270 [Escherichia albertii]|nr:hypothetical protein FYK17_12270 [Escherichia albertii]
MNFKKCFLPVAILASFTLAGCQSNADDHAADVVQSEADANRNMSEGGRDLMKSAGKAEENKSDSWFN